MILVFRNRLTTPTRCWGKTSTGGCSYDEFELHKAEANPQQIQRIALSVVEAADAIGIGKTTIYKLFKTKKLRSIKVEGRRLVMLEDLNNYLGSCGKP